MVNEKGVRRPNGAVAFFPGAKAEVGVVVGCPEVFFIKSSDFFEHVSADSHTGGGHGCIVLYDTGPADVPRVAAVEELEGVPGHAANAEDHSGVLIVSVRKNEFCPDRTDVFPHGVADHFAQPVLFDDLDIVVEEQEDVSLSPPGGPIIEPGKIEGNWL